MAAYQQALDYLFSFVDFSLTHQQNISPDRFNLARMVDMMKKLGQPQQQYPMIHIAGTKGKGSVAAICAAALQTCGYTTGLYTSPHLHDFNERIQVNGKPITHGLFTDLVQHIKPVVACLSEVTSFEIQTALAWMYFVQQMVDIAVIEAGLGGRLDSTNIITPLVSVITPISLDHTNVLGGTLESIAGEKGGIIKPKVPLVCAEQPPSVMSVLRHMAEEAEAPIIEIGRDVRYQRLAYSLDGEEFTITIDNRTTTFCTSLLGQHQVHNAAVAYATLQQLQQSGWALSDENIRRGFRQVVWPGRFEVVNCKPALVFDGAHNRHSAAQLHQTVQDYFPERKLIMIFGASEDKDIQGMFAELLPITQNLLLVQSSHPRAAHQAELRQLAADYDGEIVECDSIPEAFERAFTLAGDGTLVLVCGSLYLVGEARHHWFTEFIEHGYN